MLQNDNLSNVGNVLKVMLEEDDINNIKKLGSESMRVVCLSLQVMAALQISEDMFLLV